MEICGPIMGSLNSTNNLGQWLQLEDLLANNWRLVIAKHEIVNSSNKRSLDVGITRSQIKDSLLFEHGTEE